ncbi:MAG TPA: hypothetical protein GXZ29_02120 [Clostridiales bacterium]|nr:hypothetical protein [Clostridiales bacterium]
MSEIKKIYYVSSTHWDREWHRSFQSFRFALVNRINEIMDVLDKDPSFTSFIMDGQTIVLDDYCRIEPGKKDRLVRLINEGRIIVGPWYTMPDEYLVSGESLIRNLMIGHKLAEAYGSKAMKYGYICDIFGHIAQMPQIFRGFGIQGALLGRGTNEHNCPSHFRWKALDGSECITFKVPEETGYATFWSEVYIDYLTGKDPDKENIIKRACAYIENEKKRSDIPYILLMDGMDHERIHEIAPWVASRLSEIYGCPVVFDNLEKLVDDLKEYVEEMPVKRGELNETARKQSGHNMLITNTLSSRYDLKERNDSCEALLEKWMLPVSAIAELEGFHIQNTYTDLAYKYLIPCHAHDSICGCSIDSVHRDMHYRFRQVSDIGNEVVNAAICHLAGNTDSDPGSDYRMLSIFNPLPFPRKETIFVKVDFNKDFKSKFMEQAGWEVKNGFKLYNEKGEEIPYNLTDISYNSFTDRPGEFYRSQKDIYTLAFTADLPPMGMAQYQIVPQDKPTRYLEELSLSEEVCENEFIRLEINANGTVNIVDKETGREYRHLLSFIDNGEIGDGWHHASPIRDRIISSFGSNFMIEKIDDGPAACTFRITCHMRVPKEIIRGPHGNRRSDETAELRISSDITLAKANRWVDIKTTVYNNVKDHRLKMRIPTGITAGKYYVNQAFAFAERDTGFDRNTGDWKEPALAEKSFDSIVMKRDEEGCGIAFMSAAGLHECAALDDEDGSLYITMLRSFSKTHLTDGESDGQLQQALEYRYRLMPVHPTDSFAHLIRVKDCLQADIRMVTNRVKNTSKPAAERSVFALSGENVVLSLLKKPEDEQGNCVIVRLSNYSDSSSSAQLLCAYDIKEACETDMLEQKLTEAVFHGNKLEMEFEPWEIKTYRIVFSDR